MIPLLLHVNVIIWLFLSCLRSLADADVALKPANTKLTGHYSPLAPDIDPEIGNRGIMIDAGSGGSRLHIFSWNPRIFDTVPPPPSIPRSDEKTTERISPGISDFVDDFPGLKAYFSSLIDQCKTTLRDHQDHWYTYPFYLRATGGMRLVPFEKREKMMKYIRSLFSDKEFCPFYFQYDFARVMSGEEEAVFAWMGANYLFNTLFPSIQRPLGNHSQHETYGTVDLGGASTQISFFSPNQDISEGLFKLQVGSQRHWNLYAKSFLKYGHNSARERHFRISAESAINNESPEFVDNCMFAGYSENVSAPAVSYNGSEANAIITIRGPEVSHKNQFTLCTESLKELLLKQLNAYCDSVYDGECSMDGFYQPKLPGGRNGHFIASAMYRYPWYFLKMPTTAAIRDFKEKAEGLCAMNYQDVLKYNSNLNTSVKKDKIVQYYCFLSSYISVLLEYGYGFSENQTLTVVDSVGDHKLGWALGSMLYEINGLPFIIRPLTWRYYIFQALSFLAIGILVGAAWTWLYFRGRITPGIEKRYEYESIPNSLSSL